jgi:transmembrane sensor
MEPAEYTSDYFIQDEYFQRWVYSPDPESEMFWLEFLRNNPSQESAVSEAKLFLSFFTKDVDQGESRIEKIKQKISETLNPVENIPANDLPVEVAEVHVIEKRESAWGKIVAFFTRTDENKD